MHGWKEQLYFVSTEKPWGFNASWDQPRPSKNKKPKLWGAKGEEALEFIFSHLASSLRMLFSEQMYEVGLSLADPLGKFMTVIFYLGFLQPNPFSLLAMKAKDLKAL